LSLNAARATQLEAVLGAAGEAAEVVAVEEDDRGRAGRRKDDDRPVVAEQQDEADQASAVAIDATDA